MTAELAEGPARPFLFLHVGDQHLTGRDAQHHRDLAAIFDQIGSLPGHRDLIDRIVRHGLQPI